MITSQKQKQWWLQWWLQWWQRWWWRKRVFSVSRLGTCWQSIPNHGDIDSISKNIAGYLLFWRRQWWWIWRLTTMTTLITRVMMRNTLKAMCRPHREGEKEQQSEFSCNHCGTEFIGGVKLKRQNDPFCGPQMVTQVVWKSILSRMQKSSCSLWLFLNLQNVFQPILNLPPQKHQQRCSWWNIEMKIDEQFWDISVVHFSARHLQKEIFHALLCQKNTISRDLLPGLFWP